MALEITPGQTAAAIVVWRNPQATAWGPRLRYDLKRGGLTETWIEGPWTDADPVPPGEAGETEVRCQVPADWNNTYVAAKLQVLGITGPSWQADEVYVIGTPGMGLGDMISSLVMVMVMSMMMGAMEGVE
jgi:hypothetical protein